MQIADARKSAQRFIASHLIRSEARRPPPDARVMVRYPSRKGEMITAGDVDELQEKLAKKIKRVKDRQSLN